MDRNEFMEFFRDTEKLNTLSADDRQELFRYSLTGNSDFTKELLTEVIGDYNADLIVIDPNDKGYAHRIYNILNNPKTTSASRGRAIDLFDDQDSNILYDFIRLDFIIDSDVCEYIAQFIDMSVLYYCEGTVRYIWVKTNK